MLPVPQPKPLDDIFEKLHRCLQNNEPLGNFDQFDFKQRLEAQLAIAPVNAHMGLGILAVYDGKEAGMRQHFAMALAQKTALSTVYHNFALALAQMGYSEEAIVQLRRALDTVDADETALNHIAAIASILGADDFISEILEKASKLSVTGGTLLFAAVQMGLACDDDEEAYVRRLGEILPDDVLRQHSEPITNEDWQKMCEFADSLRQYV